MRVHSSGARAAVRIAHALKEAGNSGLRRELDRGSREAGQVIVKAIDENPAAYLPSGYEAEFIASMHSRVEVKLVQRRQITAVFWAMGRSERRKVEAINAGVLRHPVRGRTRRVKRHWKYHTFRLANPWVDQAITPGLYDEPGRGALPPAVKKLDDAVGRVVAKIERDG